MSDAMFLIARLGLFVLSVSFFTSDRPGAGGFFLGLVIIGTGVESKGIARVIIIASGVLLIGITLYVASDEINP
jgi:hypothetical protein